VRQLFSSLHATRLRRQQFSLPPLGRRVAWIVLLCLADFGLVDMSSLARPTRVFSCAGERQHTIQDRNSAYTRKAQ
jgi:hypothetical protein